MFRSGKTEVSKFRTLSSVDFHILKLNKIAQAPYATIHRDLFVVVCDDHVHYLLAEAGIHAGCEQSRQ